MPIIIRFKPRLGYRGASWAFSKSGKRFSTAISMISIVVMTGNLPYGSILEQNWAAR